MFRSSTRSDGARRGLWGALTAAALLLSACGYAPGDYIVYRLGLTQERLSDGCYPLGGPPPGVDESSSTHHTPATWVLYFATDDRVVLDIESNTLDGTETDDGYEFDGYTVDTSYIGTDQQEAKVTVVQRDSVVMTVDGTVIEGQLTHHTHTECLPLDSSASPGICNDVDDCVRTRDFTGVQLVDVDLESGVDKPNPF